VNQLPGNRSLWCRASLISVAVLFLNIYSLSADSVINADVCVYGGTSGGVIAAVQAARMGKTVALLVQQNFFNNNAHLGGMSSGGLGASDVGTLGSSYIQGLAREFYNRIGTNYGGANAASWQMFDFEPHVAEQVFNTMITNEPNITVYSNLNLVSVNMNGQGITSITTTNMVLSNNTVFYGREFIDASYEGDLMAGAGVSYTTGREGTNQYGEVYNGVRTPNTGGNQIKTNTFDPYVIPGNPGSGLIFGMNTNAPATQGSADNELMSWNYRLAMSLNGSANFSTNAPSGYNAANYELVGRYVASAQSNGVSLTMGSFLYNQNTQNGQQDINNNGGVSTDFIGQNYTYLTNTFAGRQAIAVAHLNWIKGLFYFLQTDSRCSSNLQYTAKNQFKMTGGQGGNMDFEFTDNGGWPMQLYIREGRRMVSDYVMTESNIFDGLTVTDSVGLASYTVDSHNTERVIYNGLVQDEGDVEATISTPFPVSYRSIVPKSSQCTNIFCPWSVSASHTAYGSIRLEPEFMILSQSAGTAACFAIDDGVAVQNVNLAKLQAQLTANHQMLQWGKTTAQTTLPVINLWASDAAASRVNQRSGNIIVNCAGNTNTAVTVYFNIGGSAVNGSDYQSTSGSITIPAGVAYTNISIIPYTNALPVGDETATFSLIPNAAYTVGTFALATVTISDAPINDWRFQYFGTDATNTDVAGDFANPAGDGIPNLMKYAMGLDPMMAETGASLAAWIDANDNFLVSYVRPDPPPKDINYQMEISSDLTSWSTNLWGFYECFTFNGNNTATVTCQYPVPAGNATRGFMRLMVTGQ